MTTERMTNRKALTYVLENCDVPADVEAKLKGMIEALNRKSSTERKPTARQTENASVRALLVAFINENSVGTENGGFTVSELIKSVDEIADFTNQRVSAILRLAVEGHEIERKIVKRHTYFCPVQE